MPRPRPHCHLSVLLARSAPTAVIFRRGPATWTQLITWNTHSDTFESGQWFRGKVYTRRCDISPEGDKLIYFVAKHHVQNVDPSYTSAWTAVSRPPYFTAIALWPNEGTTYHGGGLFDTGDHVLVNSVRHRWSNPSRAEPAQAHPSHLPPKKVRVSPIAFTSGDHLLVKRLLRDGWALQGADAGSNESDPLDFKGTFVREVKSRRLEVDVAYQVMHYRLFEKRRGAWHERSFERVEWADFDQAGRLVFARDGKLFAARTAQAGQDFETTELADFTDRQPAPVLAPRHAQRW